MQIKRTPIKSQSDISNARPWFEFDISSAGIAVSKGNSQGINRVSYKRINIGHALVNSHQDAATHSELWIYGLDMDGVYFFRPHSETPAEIIAHLGFYNPDLDELELLEFVEL
tara:strand:+ start:304 stop:642 length:339 start_codon:yes stop_codon:yes gene_type:complete